MGVYHTCGHGNGCESEKNVPLFFFYLDGAPP